MAMKSRNVQTILANTFQCDLFFFWKTTGNLKINVQLLYLKGFDEAAGLHFRILSYLPLSNYDTPITSQVSSNVLNY